MNAMMCGQEVRHAFSISHPRRDAAGAARRSRRACHCASPQRLVVCPRAGACARHRFRCRSTRRSGKRIAELACARRGATRPSSPPLSCRRSKRLRASAIAYARGMRFAPPAITQTTARAFFAVVPPAVWDTLTEEEERTWRRRLDQADAHLAVWSPGHDATFLERADLDDALIATVRRHLRDDAAVQWTLLPIAMRDLPLAAISSIVAALSPPPDPVVFVQIACRESSPTRSSSTACARTAERRYRCHPPRADAARRHGAAPAARSPRRLAGDPRIPSGDRLCTRRSPFSASARSRRRMKTATGSGR